MDDSVKKISKITITYKIHLEKKYGISNDDNLTELALYIEVLFKRQRTYFKSRLKEGIILNSKESKKYKKLTSKTEIEEFLEETLLHFLGMNEEVIECETTVIRKSLEQFWLSNEENFKIKEWYKFYLQNTSRSIYKEICSDSINVLCANFYSILHVSDDDLVFYRSFFFDYFEEFNVEKVESFFYAFLPMLQVSGNAAAGKIIEAYKIPIELLRAFENTFDEKLDICYWDLLYFLQFEFNKDIDIYSQTTFYPTNTELGFSDTITQDELKAAMSRLLTPPTIGWADTLIK